MRGRRLHRPDAIAAAPRAACLFAVLGIVFAIAASTARADVPMPPPSSCPQGARPSSSPHYATWCEAVSCTTAADCPARMAPLLGPAGALTAYECAPARGLCVQDRTASGVGWASGHSVTLHEAFGVCASDADCTGGAHCEVLDRCIEVTPPAVAPTRGLGWITWAASFVVVIATATVAVLAMRRRSRRR